MLAATRVGLRRTAACQSTVLASARIARGTNLRWNGPFIQVAQRRAASSSTLTPTSSTVDPTELESAKLLESGTQKLEEGDVQGAKRQYQRSVEMKRGASGLFNLGVAQFHLKEYETAIESWKEAISLQPDSADAHTNIASAYILSPIPRPDLALHHLHVAASLLPGDAEIAFNLAAVLEACGKLEDALAQYQKAKSNGIDRADMHIRNVSAKILGQRLRDEESSTTSKVSQPESSKE